MEVRASTNVTVTLSPREEERFTYTDIAVEWTDPGACIGDYFAALYNSGGAVYKNLGFHPLLRRRVSAQSWDCGGTTFPATS